MRQLLKGFCQPGAHSGSGKGAAAKETLCLIRKLSQELERFNSNSKGAGKQKTGKSKRLVQGGNAPEEDWRGRISQL